jgi:lipopolysaccharide transport system permease protein
MIQNMQTLISYRELLLMWTVRDIKVRYKQSILGGAWAILQPLSLMVMFSVIFTYFVKIDTGDIPYPIFSYTALLPWMFLTSSVNFAVPSLVQNMNLVKKIYFPREIFPLSSVAASFVDLLIASVVYIGMFIYYQIPFHTTIFLVPLLLVIQILLTLGIVLFSSALNVFYRDIRFVVPLGIQLWLYASPIIYPLSQVPESLRPIYLLNPMAGLIEAYRDVTIRGVMPDWNYLAIAAVVSIVIFIIGYLYFKHVEWQFADII